MTFDPFKLVKGVQKGIRGLGEKLGKSKNPKFKEMEKRLGDIDKKIEEKFGQKKNDEGKK